MIDNQQNPKYVFELECYYFRGGIFFERKWIEVENSRAMPMYQATITKLKNEGKQAIIALRKNGEMVCSERVNF